MNAKKKWLSGLLAAGLLLNLLPMTAMAASAENCEDADCPHAAAVGTTHFDTVQEAVNSESAETVTLLKDTSEDVTIADGQNIVLDLDGHTLTNSSNPAANSPLSHFFFAFMISCSFAECILRCLVSQTGSLLSQQITTDVKAALRRKDSSKYHPSPKQWLYLSESD